MEESVQVGEGSEVGVVPPVALHADKIPISSDFEILALMAEFDCVVANPRFFLGSPKEKLLDAGLVVLLPYHLNHLAFQPLE